MTVAAHGYTLTEFGQPLVERAFDLSDPAPGEAIVEVEACGMCHTDLGFASGAVKPNHPLPLILGHEVVGRVVAAGDGAGALLGVRVIVPAVLPCMDCVYCRAGRANACPRQKMPGNDIDGGFASHLRVPAAPLVPVAELPAGVDARALSVLSDALSTAYQAVRRSGLAADDLAVVVGVGGVGGFLVQVAHALGARVLAIDVSTERLERLRGHGADMVLDVKGKDARDVRKEVSSVARDWGIPSLAHRIFECSGTVAGQELAYGLVGRAATLVLVGYTLDKLSLRLSNLMAFDATAHGTWGAPPEVYPEVLALIAAGQIALEPFVEYAPLASVNHQLEAMAAHRLGRRIVLLPGA